jgi:hypothetical protein
MGKKKKNQSYIDKIESVPEDIAETVFPGEDPDDEWISELRLAADGKLAESRLNEGKSNEEEKATNIPSLNHLKPPGRSKNQWLLMGLGLACILMGILAGYYYMQDQRNMFLAILMLAALSGGVYLIITQYRKTGDQVVIIPGQVDGKKSGKIKVANSLNIYGKKNELTGTYYAEKIAFEMVKDPKGQPQQCINTGKYYYVHIWDIDRGILVPLVLPDTKYTDPAKMARYLELPDQKKYLRHREGLMKYIGPGILALMDAGGFITIIALGG